MAYKKPTTEEIKKMIEEARKNDENYWDYLIKRWWNYKKRTPVADELDLFNKIDQLEACIDRMEEQCICGVCCEPKTLEETIECLKKELKKG